uniref:SFRICE_002093 n=1 Tax=Spodoptera frugiperda TaxID=7108 RepID=A0A2H1VUH9_SPOFR
MSRKSSHLIIFFSIVGAFTNIQFHIHITPKPYTTICRSHRQLLCVGIKPVTRSTTSPALARIFQSMFSLKHGSVALLSQCSPDQTHNHGLKENQRDITQRSEIASSSILNFYNADPGLQRLQRYGREWRACPQKKMPVTYLYQDHRDHLSTTD